MEKNGEVRGVRKGTWTMEEDNLLRNCIDNFGEGKWHLVPLRAGLNRCRKSCRLRWLNYLKPNLKRGHFNEDEVDLILRLHKLLGNRWSLIAGRLPGRTGNDVKNFWNTHFQKKPRATTARKCSRGTKAITWSNIIRPQPYTISKSPVDCPTVLTRTTMQQNNDENPFNHNLTSSTDSFSQQILNDCLNMGDEDPNNGEPSDPLISQEDEVDECIRWWSKLLEMSENEEENRFSFPTLDRPFLDDADVLRNLD